MNLSERDNFDEQWRKALEEASEAPPPSLWDAIEEKLDEKKKKRGLVLPLWWNHVPMGYAAAALAVVVLVGWSVWSTMNQNPGFTQVAATKDSGASKKIPATEQLADKSSKEITTEVVVPEQKQSKETTIASAEVKQNVEKERFYDFASKKSHSDSRESSETALDEKKNAEVADLKVAEAVAVASSELASDVQKGNSSVDELQLIEARGFTELSVYPRRRYVFYKVAGDDFVEPKLDNKSKKEYWAGVGLMPSSFDPNVNVKSAPLFSNLISNGQSMSSTSVAETSTSEARLSYSVQAQTGMKISKNWSIETGISYLQGNSVFKSEGYALDKLSSRSSNVLESAIYSGTSNKAPEYMLTTGTKTEEPAGLYIDVSQKKSNEYRYLQLPVQVGYTLNPSGKLSYTVLGGMVGNFFLQNQLETNSGYVLTTKASDNVYRSLNWAGSSGLRFNFRLSPHWVMNMTGSFQKSIMTIFKDNNNLESKPQLYGVGWGMRYTF